MLNIVIAARATLTCRYPLHQIPNVKVHDRIRLIPRLGLAAIKLIFLSNIFFMFTKVKYIIFK